MLANSYNPSTSINVNPATESKMVFYGDTSVFMPGQGGKSAKFNNSNNNNGS